MFLVLLLAEILVFVMEETLSTGFFPTAGKKRNGVSDGRNVSVPDASIFAGINYGVSEITPYDFC